MKTFLKNHSLLIVFLVFQVGWKSSFYERRNCFYLVNSYNSSRCMVVGKSKMDTWQIQGQTVAEVGQVYSKLLLSWHSSELHFLAPYILVGSCVWLSLMTGDTGFVFLPGQYS